MIGGGAKCFDLYGSEDRELQGSKDNKSLIKPRLLLSKVQIFILTPKIFDSLVHLIWDEP